MNLLCLTETENTMDWDLCVICQNNIDNAPLSCPKNRQNRKYDDVYKDFLDNVKAFEEMGALPVDIDFGEQGTPECFAQNNASWHRSCHQKFNKSKLDRELNRKRKQLEDEEVQSSSTSQRSKRQSTGLHKNTCLFCDECGTKTLHEYATKSAEYNLKLMATEMQDGKVLAKIMCGDLVSNELKYHLHCLTRYRNDYRGYRRQSSPSRADQRELNQQSRMIQSRTFIELITYMEESAEEGTYLFKLSTLHNLFEKRLRDFSMEITINKTRLKDKIIEHFSQQGLEEKSDGKCTILAFPAGIQQLLKDAFLFHDYDEEAKLFARVAKICREEILKEKITFCGEFNPGCQQEITPSTRLLMSMIIYGPNLAGSVKDSQPCLTLTQLLVHNCKKKGDIETMHQRYSPDREPPVPLYVGLNLHTQTRSKTLVNQMANLGISVSYKRVIEVENEIAASQCEQYRKDGVVCPNQLRNGLFTVSALDNLDHNPSSTTSQGSFHGTGISIIQQPTTDQPGVIRNHPAIVTNRTSISSKSLILPESFSIVPAVYMKHTTTEVPEIANTTRSNGANHIDGANVQEEQWIQHASELLQQDLVQEQSLSWAAYHASRQPQPNECPAITALLPLFVEKADSAAMVKHGMSIIQNVTEFLNPGQIPVMACDCPIFAMSKYIQWKFPTTHGESLMVIMFGGLHLEKALWTGLGDLLDASGWIEALTESGIATPGTAQSFLKVSHITRTRHAHQISVLALGKLQQDAFDKAIDTDNDDEKVFDSWKVSMIDKCPTFQYWDMVLRLEQAILIFVRSHRENNFQLYLEVLESLMFMFFALDHYNYSRWVSVHVRDMKSLPASVKADLEKHWVVVKGSRRFSAIPIDQTHEQENAKVKGKGGAIGLTERPEALKRWMIAGPEQSRLITSFENEYLASEEGSLHYHHHEEGLSAQRLFQKQTINFIETINTYGNPFSDDCQELLVLHTRQCADHEVVNTMKGLEALGNSQYHQFQKSVFIEKSRSIHESIKKNKLHLFKTPKPKKTSKMKELAAIRSDASLFGRLYIANQQRDGDLDVFFSHENQLFPPSISDHGKLRSGTKSDLIRCIEHSEQDEIPSTLDCKIFDGAVLVHTLSAATTTTFDDYAHDVFLPFLLRELQHVNSRIDVVWDRYLPHSIKASTRARRGSGVRLKVSPQTKIPSKWNDFLLDVSNKDELFSFLTQKVANGKWPAEKGIYITNGISVVSRGASQLMSNCTHEEADSRIVVHIVHALQHGSSKIQVRTVDTDVLVILVGHFFDLCQLHPDLELSVALGVGKDFCVHNINVICQGLGERIARALPVFHAFSGSDTTSYFFRKGKKSAWHSWKSYPDVTDAFLSIWNHPFEILDTGSPQFRQLERYTIVIYDKTSAKADINDARRELFSKKSRTLDNIPPTKVLLVFMPNNLI